MRNVNRTHEIFDNKPHVYSAELTDTYGGEANYSWVKRAEISFDENYTDRQLMLRVKAELGLTGVRCEVDDFGDSLTIRPRGLLQIAFVNFNY